VDKLWKQWGYYVDKLSAESVRPGVYLAAQRR